jgi:hypothetical protein
LGSLVVKSVTDQRELKAALRLRREIGRREIGKSLRLPGLSLVPRAEPTEFASDHLIIVDKRSGKIVGAFQFKNRGLSSPLDPTRQPSLAQDFLEPGMGFEVGQAFLHEDYRRGIAASLLRKGVAEHAAKTAALSLIG